MTSEPIFDFVVIGGGLVGLATARALMGRFPSASLALVEKESQVATHQSGRNSGVLHSGIYYKPGSLKAQLTAEGRRAMIAFCEENNIALEFCGKVILATREEELSGLEEIYRNGVNNGIDVRQIDLDELAEIEPHARGIQAVWVPQTGIADYPAVAGAMVEELRSNGAKVKLGTRLLVVEKQNGSVRLVTSGGEIYAKLAVNCAGLFSDRLARQAGLNPGLRIIPFRGEYFRLKSEAKRLVRGLIYPLADPRFPFLGIHLTKMIDDEVLVGPNAVLAHKREGYDSRAVNLRDSWETLSYVGFWRLVLPNLSTGLAEMLRSGSVAAFAHAAQQLVPEIRPQDLLPTRSGVRAQAVDRDGKLVDDFRIMRGECWLHVLNAPSPAATACLAIGEYVAKQADEMIR